MATGYVPTNHLLSEEIIVFETCISSPSHLTKLPYYATMAHDETWNELEWQNMDWSDKRWSQDKTWSNKTWSDKTWSNKTWGDKTWSNKTWGDKTWSNKTWGVKTWNNEIKYSQLSINDGHFVFVPAFFSHITVNP